MKKTAIIVLFLLLFSSNYNVSNALNLKNETLETKSTSSINVVDREIEIEKNKEFENQNNSNDENVSEPAETEETKEMNEVNETNELIDITDEAEIELTYRSYLQSVGWTDNTLEGDASGDPDSGLRIESIEIASSSEIGLRYGVHVQSLGWQDERKSGGIAGTTGESKRIEAIWIDIDEATKETYDILYSVYVEGYGWLDWTKNGERTGSMGLSKRIESIKVKIVRKEEMVQYNIRNLLLEEKNVNYSGHVQRLGWIEKENQESYLGTIGASLRLEALNFNNAIDGLEILHTSHVSKIGWSKELSSSEICGTTGKSLAMEAIKLRLSGKNMDYYDLYYRVHVQSIGWMSWTKNGLAAGTTGLGLRIEAVEIRVLPKGSNKIVTNENQAVLISDQVGIDYRSHVQSIGWMKTISNGSTSGTTNIDKRLEGFTASVVNNQWLQVSYSALVSGSGWQEYVSESDLAGTTGQNGSIEAVRFELKGNMAKYFNIIYRVYASDTGWIGWSVNGNPNGSEGFDHSVEAMEVMIIPKTLKSSYGITNPYKQNLIPIAKKVIVYYTKESCQLYSATGNGKSLTNVPKANLLFGVVKDKYWLQTEYDGYKGYMRLDQLSAHQVTAAGKTIIVNKGYGLPASFSPGVNYEASKALNRMVKSASSIGIQLNMYSGYRSYLYQNTLFNRYMSQDGRAAAETYSMRPGFSEHQTGLSFDIGGRNSSLWTSSSFGRTTEGIWLRENADRFGFILRYPEGKQHITGIRYEPWHFRYVGVELAQKITESGKTLDEYFNVISPNY